MQIEKNFPLAEMTSFRVGGLAEKLVTLDSTENLYHFIKSNNLVKPIWVLGSGTNVLVSDKGLPGTTLVIKSGSIKKNGNQLTAAAGVWWDDLVRYSIKEKLWGLELMSGIPGGVGAAVVGNIAAYGQSVDQTLKSIEVIDLTAPQLAPRMVPAKELDLKYRYSKFQTKSFANLLITKANFELSQVKTVALEYSSALKVAEELGGNLEKLNDRREIILEARRRAGSLIESEGHHTAGSFFKNPLVSENQMEKLLEHDEWGVSKQHLKQQQKIHGGSVSRISASLVLLAAGFKRGQNWGPVRLHPDHVLKIENTGGAKARQIYDVAQEIIRTVKDKLDITLEPEVRFIGDFD